MSELIRTPVWFAMAAIVFLFSLTRIYAQRSANGLKLPPGPRRIPLLGNILQVPRVHLGTYFRGLIDTYGGLVSLNLAGFPVILIGDARVAKDLLEKRGEKHSSRPILPYIRDHVHPTGDNWGLLEDGYKWMMGRRLTTRIMSAVRAGKTEPVQELEALQNIQHLLDDSMDSEEWFHHVNRHVTNIVLAVGFGIRSSTRYESDLRDSIFNVVIEAIDLVSPSSTIVNVFPFLDWIPGPAPWRTHAQSFREREEAIYNKLFDEALTGKGYGIDTWAASFANKDSAEGDQRHMLRTIVEGSIETTTSSLHTFILACICYPDWIAETHKKIDEVVGDERMPSFKDRGSLPCIDAIVREILRWRPAPRFGIPHQTTKSDVIRYQGQTYSIPEGSIIFAVPWAIEHDASRFKDPDRFMPNRFLDDEGELKPDYETSTFGFGRRICPGIPFAERTLWITIATMLWTFNITGSEKPDPKTGLPFHYDDSDAAFLPGISARPREFPAVFRPRSDKRVEVARREWGMYEKDLQALLSG